ncbi:MAG: hypothetical protein AB1Z57_04985 [Acidimicrobiia bacterium]
MSEYGVVEYEAFTLDPVSATPAPRPRRSRAWAWLVVGLLVGFGIGFGLTADPTTSPGGPEASPLPRPDREGAAPVLVPTRATLAEATGGFVGDLNLLLTTESGTAHARLLPQRESPWIIDPQVDPSVEPDAGGRALGRLVDHPDGTSVEARSTPGLPAEGGVWLGDDVAGWAWSRTTDLTIVWSEASDRGGTLIRHRVLGGPERSPIVVGGEWRVTDLAWDKAVVVSNDAIGLVDLETAQLYLRMATPPVRVAGLFGDLVLGEAGDGDPIQVDLDGTYGAAPPWWEPAADVVLDDPGTGWGAQVLGDTVHLHAPDGATEFIPTSGTPTWSANGRHLVVPQGSAVLVLDTRMGTRALVDVGAPVERVWVAG